MRRPLAAAPTKGGASAAPLVWVPIAIIFRSVFVFSFSRYSVGGSFFRLFVGYYSIILGYIREGTENTQIIPIRIIRLYFVVVLILQYLPAQKYYGLGVRKGPAEKYTVCRRRVAVGIVAHTTQKYD